VRTTAKEIDPEDYILSVLSPEERLDSAFRIAREAFKETKLTIKDVEDAIERIRKKAYKEKK